jgi:hypothetical protein
MKLISPDQASAINHQFLQQAFFHDGYGKTRPAIRYSSKEKPWP